MTTRPLTPRDLVLLHAAASALRHAPERLRAAHLAPRLLDLAARLEREVEREAEGRVAA